MQQQPEIAEKVYCFLVDGKRYESPRAIITGAEIRELAGVDPQLRVFADDGGGSIADRQILDHTPINLAESGEEKFYTLARPSYDTHFSRLAALPALQHLLKISRDGDVPMRGHPYRF